MPDAIAVAARLLHLRPYDTPPDREHTRALDAALAEAVDVLLALDRENLALRRRFVPLHCPQCRWRGIFDQCVTHFGVGGYCPRCYGARQMVVVEEEVVAA